ncbi:hypothetical protein [Devosia sp. 66-22]|uniref:hypothetical protein n=1 Tax=Devosia sp. 66-22 TaxID=1895753 RepID=UPI000927886C|nr:hypothetical protein [Devosia sp. 66-22]OJX48051.1 MAG: hypothetical protein BGO81_06385 [Devosia sp. 66-22]
MIEHNSIHAALAALEAAPLSRKKAMLLVLLLDEATGAGADDPLARRAELAAAHPALATVMDLAAMRETGPRLVLEPVAVDAAEAAVLREADYMVSLYNGATVQRLRIAWADARRADALDLLRRAAAALER